MEIRLSDINGTMLQIINQNHGHNKTRITFDELMEVRDTALNTHISIETLVVPVVWIGQDDYSGFWQKFCYCMYCMLRRCLACTSDIPRTYRTMILAVSRHSSVCQYSNYATLPSCRTYA